MHGTSGAVCLPSTWLPELLGPGKGKKHMPNQVCALAEYPRINLSSLDLGSAQNAVTALDSTPAEHPGA